MNIESKPVVPLDRGRINPLDPLELEYWCAEFGCSAEQLEAAIADVGEHVAAVRERLHQRGPGRAAPGRARFSP